MVDKAKALKLIGRKYQERKADLRERIGTGDIRVEEGDHDKDYTCFFCLEKIEDKVRVLVDNILVHGVECETEYSCCNDCYSSANHLIYYMGVPSSIN